MKVKHPTIHEVVSALVVRHRRPIGSALWRQDPQLRDHRLQAWPRHSSRPIRYPRHLIILSRSARAGHTSVRFTLDRYGHLHPEACGYPGGRSPG
jgi:hypothetical protein